MITKSESFTAEANNLYYIDAAGEITVTLPDPATVADESRVGFIVKNAGFVVSFSGTIAGSTTWKIGGKHEFFTIIACGGEWYPLFTNVANFGDTPVNEPADINFKTTGTTDIYTVPTGKLFLPDRWFWVVTDATSGSDPSWSVGTNGAAYDNMIGYSGTLQNHPTNGFYCGRWAGGGNTAVSGGTTIKVNVTNAGAKTTCKGKILLFGTLI